MRVAYFSNQFADRQGHGLARYSRELFAALQSHEGDADVTPVAAWSSLAAVELAGLQADTGLQILPWGQKLTPLAWTFLKAPRIERWLPQTVDLVHAVALGYPIATGKPFVVTIHDIGPLTHPHYFSPKGSWIMRRSLAQVVNKADGIICVSESTADGLESYVGGQIAGRIRVVHEGISRVFLRPPDSPGAVVLEQLGLELPASGDIPFILSAEAISPRKNLLRIIQALTRHSLPEVAGDAALLVDPASVDEIADAIEAICTDAALATDLAARGREQIKAFSWDFCAQNVLGVYRSVL